MLILVSNEIGILSIEEIGILIWKFDLGNSRLKTVFSRDGNSMPTSLKIGV